MNRKSVLVIIVILVMLTGALISGLAYTNSRTFNLTLVVSPVNSGSGSSDQFAFYVLSNGKLTSSSDIVLPSNTLIEVTIFEHDPGLSPPFVDYAQNVLGTQMNRIILFNNVLGVTSANKVPNLGQGRYVMQVNSSDISDTFSISNGVNIPIPPLIHSD